MTYAMVLAGVGTLLLSTSALAAPSHGHSVAGANSTMAANNSAAFNNDGGRSGDDNRDRAELVRLFDGEMKGILHNPHCDPDDRSGPDGDHDDRAANNPGRGHHEGRCIGRPASP